MRKLSTTLTEIVDLARDLRTELENSPKVSDKIKIKANELKRRISLARLDSRHLEDEK